MLKKILVFIFVFTITVLISGFLYGSLIHLVEKIRTLGIGAQTFKRSYYMDYQEDIKFGLTFTLFSAIIYFPALYIISRNQKPSLLKQCIIASIAALSFIIFILLITYGFSSLTIISILLLLLICIIQGSLIALVATVLNNMFNRIGQQQSTLS